MRKMKDSGIAWIGEIPEGWNCDKINRLFCVIGSGTTPKGEEPYINGTIAWLQSGDLNGEILFKANKYINADTLNKYSALKVYKAPYIILAMYGASVGNVSIATFDASVNQACCVLGESKNHIKFAYYCLAASNKFLIEKSIGSGQPNISQAIIRNMWLPNPTLLEQQHIADFLDKKCAEIDKLIELQESMIEKLKEYKQSVITQAVTKGLDPDVLMKDSGIEWIGKIPEGWAIIPLKYCCKANQRVLSEKTDDNLLLEYIDIASVDDCGNINNVQLLEFKDAPSRARRIVKTNDIIISTVRTYLKAIARITDDYDNDICSTGFAVLTPNKIKEGYLYYALFSNIFTSRVEMYSTGISYPAINTSSLIALSIAVPNSNEQQQIADYLDKKCAEIDDLIKLKEQKIEKLKEYKKSLIYEYVTGKKEVV